MKSRAILAAIILAVLSALPTVASAAFVHYFNCELCHRADAAWNTVTDGGICIDCHNGSGGTVTFNAVRPGDPSGVPNATLPKGFAHTDASNAMGNNPAATQQLSHNWGARDFNPAAGALPPTAAMYSTRRMASAGFVTCYRCHDPHTNYDPANAGTEMLRTKTIGDGTDRATEQNIEAMCVDCHRDWANKTPAEHGLGSHPMYLGDYLNDYKSDPRFNTDGALAGTVPFVPNGEMTLLTGNKIGCSTCHGVHFTDSDAATADGPGLAATGDGKLLKGDGAAVDSLALCTSCHAYIAHPSSSGTPMGCLDCHSGHSYNGGSPNYYVLRGEVTVPATSSLPTAGTTVTGIVYDDLAMAGKDRYLSYCTKCHGAVTDTSPGGISENQTHTGAEDCTTCHEHGKTFAGGNCVSCHGYAPKLDTDGSLTEGGYAHSLVNPANDYSTAGAPIYKNEAATPHDVHYTTFGISCDKCHGDNPFASPNHDTGSFQNVLDLAAPSALPGLTTDNGALVPTYNTAGAGTCSAVYCHSNGVAGGTTASPTWAGQAGSIVGQPGECQACHGNDVPSMTTKLNSATHLAHVGRFSCNYCHSQTASSSTALASIVPHVNGNVELSYDGTVTIGAIPLTGTASAAGCAVYCHSNGGSTTAARVNSTPTWANAASGACGTCHQYSVGGVATGTGAALGGAHAKHLYDADGPKAACDDCHTNVGTGADHVNGAPSLTAGACLTCHGATAAGTGVDAEPAWGTPTSVTCETCHSGTVAVINAVSAPPMPEAAYDNGHGKAAINLACTDCHSAAADINHLGGATTTRLLGTLPAYSATDDRAFCTNCHGATTNNHSTIDGTVCKTCHNQHGEDNGNDAMIMSSIAGNPVTGFADKTVRSSYIKADGTGICQTCHTSQLHFSRVPLKFEDATHKPGQLCTDCHHHDGTPAFVATGDSCDSCHGYPPKNAAHVLHAPDSDAADTLGKVYRDGTNGYADVTACAYCHTGADLYTYDPGLDKSSGTPGRINHNVGIDNTARVTVLSNSVGYAGTNLNCTGACHAQTEGKAANWTDSSLTCASCHLNPPQNGGGDGSAHVDHIAAGLTCGTCHGVDPAAGDTSHISAKSGTELQKIQARAVALAANVPITEPSWNGTNNTCSTATCHNPSNDGHIADWDTSISNGNCALCHVDTTGNPGTGSHTAHRTGTEGYTAPIACAECHTVPVATNHRNGVVEVPLDGTLATSGTATAAGTTWTKASATCSATYCHDGSLIGGSKGYSDPGATVVPVWGSNLLVGTIADCGQCHDNPPNPSKVPDAHVNNPACFNCHDNVVDVTYDAFTNPALHVDGTLDVSGGDTCLDCHNGADIDGGTRNGVHNSHTDPLTFLFGKGVAAGDYGGADWYTTTYVNGKPMFGCGQCHPAAEGTLHPTNGLNLDIDPAGETPPVGSVKLLNAAQSTPSYTSRASVTCASVYCHSDANGGFKTTPNWYGGTIGTLCADCHGNSPVSNAHGVHEVGIHYAEIYDPSGPGLLTSTGGAGSGAGHGDPNVSSTIGCGLCHAATVDLTNGMANAGNTTCDNCHSDTNNAVIGNELMSVSTTATTHIDGVKDVVFADLTTFKSKAQLRDDITGVPSVNGAWSRTNGYKAANSYDLATAAAPSFDGTTCSTVACHNGIAVSWQVPSSDCFTCHKELPK